MVQDNFVGFPGFPGRTWVETVGGGPGRAARVSSGKSGWRAARFFGPTISKFLPRALPPPFGLQVCHALKFSYKHYRGIAIYTHHIYTLYTFKHQKIDEIGLD